MEISNGRFISFVVADKCDMRDLNQVAHLTRANPVPPKFGRNWWFSWPVLRLPGEQYVTVWQLTFLCFSLDYSNYNRRPRDW